LYSSITLEFLDLVLISGEEQITQQSMDMGAIDGIENLDITITPTFPD
jgi:hypothetical protein